MAYVCSASYVTHTHTHKHTRVCTHNSPLIFQRGDEVKLNDNIKKEKRNVDKAHSRKL